MTDEDVFRRAFEMGSAFFALTQKRAESMLQDLADSGESARDQAQKVVDDAVEKGRQRTVDLVDLVRSEIRAQVAALGLATKDDIARLEAKLDAVAPDAPPARAAAEGAPGGRSGSQPSADATAKPTAAATTKPGAAATTKPAAAAKTKPAAATTKPAGATRRSAGAKAAAAKSATGAGGGRAPRRRSPGAAPGDGPPAERS